MVDMNFLDHPHMANQWSTSLWVYLIIVLFLSKYVHCTHTHMHIHTLYLVVMGSVPILCNFAFIACVLIVIVRSCTVSKTGYEHNLVHCVVLICPVSSYWKLLWQLLWQFNISF